MGFRKDLGKFIFPNPTHSNQDRDDNLFFAPWVTCKEAIGDLDYALKEDKEKIPGSKDKELLKLVPPEIIIFLLKKEITQSQNLNGDQDTGLFY